MFFSSSLLLSLLLLTAAEPVPNVFRRAEQTSAVCAGEYSWMDNHMEQSPCLVAAFVIGACASGDWNVPALTPGYKYDSPNASTANGCSCSWSAYNLLSACTVCQNSSAPNWDAYAQYCGGLDSSYFPTNVTLPVETAIPFWAITDPTTWTDARFNTSAAYRIASQEYPDITSASIQASAQKSKKSPGPIIGAVIGSLAIVAIFVVLFVWYKLHKHPAPTKVLPFFPVTRQRHLPQRSVSSTTNQSVRTMTNLLPGGGTGMQQFPADSSIDPAVSTTIDRSNSTRTAFESNSSHQGHPIMSAPSTLLRMLSGASRRPAIQPFYGNQQGQASVAKDQAGVAGAAAVMSNASVRPLRALNQSPSPPTPPQVVMSIARATAGETDTDGLATLATQGENAHLRQMNPPAYTLLPEPEHVSTTRVRAQGLGHRRPTAEKGGSLDSHSSSSETSGSHGGSLSRLVEVPSAVPESEVRGAPSGSLEQNQSP